MLKAFHPYGLSICLNEKAEDYGFTFEAIQKAVNDLGLMQQFKPTILVADGAAAITNGFIQAFGELIKRVMCWAHMIRKVDDKLSHIDDANIKLEIRDDICTLQLARNEKIFTKASSLFLLKWNRVDCQSVKKFISKN